MPAFEYRDGALFGEGVGLDEIAAKAGTPCYVYSGAAILEKFRAYDAAFGDVPHLVCYAVKANSNLSLLKLLADAGAGFDIVSGGELYRVLKAGGDPAKPFPDNPGEGLLGLLAARRPVRVRIREQSGVQGRHVLVEGVWRH